MRRAFTAGTICVACVAARTARSCERRRLRFETWVANSISGRDVQHGETFFDAVGDEKEIAILLLENSFGGGVVQEREQRVIEAIDIEQEGWLGVELEGLPSEHFKHFFESTEASGEDEELSL